MAKIVYLRPPSSGKRVQLTEALYPDLTMDNEWHAECEEGVVSLRVCFYIILSECLDISPNLGNGVDGTRDWRWLAPFSSLISSNHVESAAGRRIINAGAARS